ncbi:MAG: hypothetical protein JOZ19_02270 [Rubrobacter sp.]|nr:hypothetical protein [Rubrobacter sp.]
MRRIVVVLTAAAIAAMTLMASALPVAAQGREDDATYCANYWWTQRCQREFADPYYYGNYPPYYGNYAPYYSNDPYYYNDDCDWDGC